MRETIILISAVCFSRSLRLLKLSGGFLSFAESELSDLNHMTSTRQGETIWAEML